MIYIILILLNGWCRMRMRPARLVSYAFLYTTDAKAASGYDSINCFKTSHAFMKTYEQKRKGRGQDLHY